MPAVCAGTTPARAPPAAPSAHPPTRAHNDGPLSRGEGLYLKPGASPTDSRSVSEPSSAPLGSTKTGILCQSL